MAPILLVGLGGFIGSITRYSISLIAPRFISTMIVNLIGSFIIGALFALGETRLNQTWYIFLVPGILGGFTTYSAFSGETFLLLKEGSYLHASLYVGLTFVTGIALTSLGFFLIKSLIK